jgi:hypothetical protein
MKLMKIFAVAALAIGSAFAQYSSPVRSVDDPGRTPAAFSGQLNFTASSSAAGDSTTVVVPAGKRLVIDQVFFYSYMQTGYAPLGVTIYLTMGGKQVQFAYNIPIYSTINSTDWYLLNQPCTMVADPGTTVQLVATRGGFPNPPPVQWTLGGHWVGLP